jgi:hypothetical protein
MATPRAAGGRRVTSRPPISTLPSLAVSNPATIRRQVVLPQPDGPSNTVNLPGRTCNEMRSSAVALPQRRLTAVNRTSAPAISDLGESLRSIFRSDVAPREGQSAHHVAQPASEGARDIGATAVAECGVCVKPRPACSARGGN